MSYVAKTAQQALNVTDFFQPGDPDYTQAFVRAIAEADSRKINIFIPPGVWDVSETVEPSNVSACIRFSGVSGFEMFGVPGVSVIRLAGGDIGAPVRLAIIQIITNCSRISLRDFVIDGNESNIISPPSVYEFGIDVASGTDIDIDGIIVHSLNQLASFRESAGIKVGERVSSPGGGQLTGVVERVTIRNCTAYDVDFGYYLFEEGDALQIVNSIAFDCRDNAIVMQPRDTGLVSVLVDGVFCTLTGSPANERVFSSQSGGIGPPLVQRLIVRNSSFIGSISCLFNDEYIATNNVIFYEGGTSTNACIEMAGLFSRGVVTDNVLIGFDESAFRIFFATATQGEHLYIANNFILTRRGVSTTANAIKNLTFINNTLVHNGSFRDDGIEYRHTTGTEVGGDINIIDNYFEGDWSPAINVEPSSTDPAGTIKQVRIIGNEFRTTQSVVISVVDRYIQGGASFENPPIIARNNARANQLTLNQTFKQTSGIEQLQYRAYVHKGNPGGSLGGVAYLSYDNPIPASLPGNQCDRCNDLSLNAEATSYFPLVVAPFNLSDGDTLHIVADGGPTQIVTFNSIDVGNINAVTQAEAIGIINAQTDATVIAGGETSGFFNGRLGVRSATAGSAASLQILSASTADTKFGLDNLIHYVGGLWVHEGGTWVKK